MATLRAQVVLPYLSGKTEDVAVNTYHFLTQDFSDTTVNLIRDFMVELYNTGGTGVGGAPAGPIAGYLSNALSRLTDVAKVKVYDLADVKPRPVKERSWTLGGSLGSTAVELPAEVALCASFYATRNIARQRGRIYLGPFHIGATDDDVTFSRARPVGALREGVHLAFKRLAAKAPSTVNLAVYSKTDGIARLVTHGWVDDAWDTQRRRGQDAALRIPWTA